MSTDNSNDKIQFSLAAPRNTIKENYSGIILTEINNGFRKKKEKKELHCVCVCVRILYSYLKSDHR